MEINSNETIKKVLDDCKTIAVVGLSSNPGRPSYNHRPYMFGLLRIDLEAVALWDSGSRPHASHYYSRDYGPDNWSANSFLKSLP